MQEDFLHFIWQFQYYEQTNLMTQKEEPLTILEKGTQNTQAGADFSEARIRIGEVLWAGDVEIHLCASDWEKHQHHLDPHYNKVILHVVWIDDQPVYRQDGSTLPTLALRTRVDVSLLHRYQHLQQNKGLIACERHWPTVAPLQKLLMLDKAASHRLERKATAVKVLFKQCEEDWERLTFRLLVQSFGFKVNQDGFELLAQSIPVRSLYKQKDQLLQLEAIFFGQAGFLEEVVDDPYHTQLRQEYQFLRKKYQLEQVVSPPWKFMRLRPANFPTIRLAQLANLFYQQESIFSRFIHFDSYQTLSAFLSVTASSYWQTHYHFQKPFSKKQSGRLGKGSMDSLVVNTIVPLLVFYAKQKDKPQYLDKAVATLEEIKAENNKITRIWEALGLSVKNAFDSQALIEQYNMFCQPQRCLHCTVGAQILSKEAE
ncbi:MAG: DUF2851 family protein [Bacteroidota bacterium]